MYASSFLLASILCAALGSAFTNPIRNPGADPAIVVASGTYYLTTTGATKIAITRSSTIGGLLNGETKTVWTDTDPRRNADMWAPEMHQIDGIWYMFYSANGINGKRCHVLKGCDAVGPYDCEYTYLADLTPPAGFQGGPNKDETESIDGSYLEISSQRYHLVSALDPDGISAIQITELNTADWTTSGWNIIAQADQAWERDQVALVEGPHPLYHNGSVWLTYSGSFCASPNYALGLLQYVGDNPLSRDSWVKAGPVVTSANGNYGTGHNCFFNSPDGTEIWNAFHATANSGGNCGGERYVMAQKMAFDQDNVPIFGVPTSLDAVLQVPSGER